MPEIGDRRRIEEGAAGTIRERKGLQPGEADRVRVHGNRFGRFRGSAYQISQFGERLLSNRETLTIGVLRDRVGRYILNSVPLLNWSGIAIILFAAWSYNTPPVTFDFLKLEQVASDPEKPDLLRFKVSKRVHWRRLCPGISHQMLTPIMAGKVSAVPIQLEDHSIDVQPQIGNYEGDRFLSVPSAQMPSGRYRYSVCSVITCWPWEDWRWPGPIMSDCAQATVTVN